MAIHGIHAPGLVALSCVVAVIASFAALTLAERVSHARGAGRLAWIAGGAMTLGLGIWGMHFVGMLAFRLPVPVTYAPGVVVLSVAPAVLASALAFWLVSRDTLDLRGYVGGALSMGLAIAGMHYVGMVAMRMDAALSYRPVWALASIFIAVLASLAALFLTSRQRDDWSLGTQAARLGAAVLMGLAISGMHYTGMHAAVFHLDPSSVASGVLYQPSPNLVLGISGGVLFVTFLALGLALLERLSPQPSLFQLGVVMIVVPLSVGAVTMTLLYRNIGQQEERLVMDVATRQNAALVSMVRMHAAATPVTGVPDDFRRTLAEALSGAVGALESSGAGSFTVVTLSGDTVRHFLEPERDASIRSPSVPEAVRRALRGESGSFARPQPDGSETLFVYESLPESGLAVVSTVPMLDVRGPFVRAFLVSALVAMLLVLAGLGLFVRLGSPLVERAKEGEFLDSVLEYAPASWVVEDPKRGIVRVNSTFEETFGIPHQSIEGKYRHEMGASPELLWLFDEMEQEARATGRSVREFDFPTGDGRVVPVRGTVGVAQGLPEGSLFWVLEDVTDRRAAREALVEGRKRAEEASRAKSAFLATMSHEIRTPMNGVMGMLDLLLDTELTPEQRDIAEVAARSAESLLDLLNSVLDFSKVEAGALRLETLPMDLEGTVYDAVRTLKIQAVERGNELVVSVDERLPRTLLGDPLRIRQIVTNLVSNAIKFTENGEVRLSVTHGGRDGAREDVVLTVEDTGRGIPEDKLQRIFEEFEQADASTTRLHGGTGLGLAITRRLVELMGGEVSVESTLGEGTRFTVRLTLDAAPEGSSVPRGSGTVRLEGKRILILDDSATARKITGEAVLGAGGKVHEASGAMEGLDLLLAAKRTGDPFDVVISDSMMPEADGFELARRIQEHPELRGTRILMLTSGAESDGRERARASGINGYLSKPVRRSDLLLALSNVLGHRGPGEEPERRVVTDASLASQRNELRVLLAEDSTVNQRVAVSMLEKRGYRVDVVDNGLDAVEAAIGGQYDVVLMDLEMPGIDGLEATRRIRAAGHDDTLPIIALTAHALDDQRARCLAAGMTGFLTKPYRADQLYAVVEGWDGEASPGEPSPPEPQDEDGNDPVDLDGLRAALRESGIEEVMGPTLQAWMEETPSRMEALEAALERGDLHEVSRGAHAMKSAAGTVHAEELAGLLQRLERAAANRNTDESRDLAHRAGALTRAALAQIREHLQKSDAP